MQNFQSTGTCSQSPLLLFGWFGPSLPEKQTPEQIPGLINSFLKLKKNKATVLGFVKYLEPQFPTALGQTYWKACQNF
jgi:hypothetical protein